MALQFTDQNFKTETAKGFAIVDMYADWCGPCKMMAPIFEDVAQMYAGKVKMGKLNVDESPLTPGTFGVSGIPSVVFLKDGQEVFRLVGFQSKDVFIAKIQEIFGVK
ncbi:MAG: thioredoxin [Patescibacteria group bacterium]